jgi:KUP system potassium uptake protein
MNTNNHSRAPATNGSRLAALTFSALGVVFGDIGTSPLYSLRECFHGSLALEVTTQNVLGIVSLVFWSLILIISVKYMMFVLNADNRGEGGILALMTLLSRDKKDDSKRQMVLLSLGLFGAALLFGDGIITPAISVLSAVEGLNVATNVFQPFIVPIALAILTLLFFFQHRGTGRIGYVFGPILLVWFAAIALLGIASIIEAPSILAAVNPYHAINFFSINAWRGFTVLGIVFLVLTGGEALYADIGHFGKTPIRVSWFTVVLPSLVLNYFGQGAHLLKYPEDTENLFYQLAPSWALYPMVILATTATVIASQAIISGAYSLARQAVQLGFLPRMAIVHTSDEKIGQVYIPTVNWILLAGTVGLILGFKESGNLASAYGIAVSADMVITTILMAFVARKLWGAKLSLVVLVASVFAIIDLSFFTSNVSKLLSGGWVILVIAGTVYAVLATWKKGRDILRKNFEDQALDIHLFVNDVRERKPTRVSGVAVFLTGNATGTPRTLLHNYKHNKIIHEHTVLLTVRTEEIPYVPADERTEVSPVGAGVYRVQLNYGFSENPDIPAALQMVKTKDLEFEPMKTTYFLGRETLIITKKPIMAGWRKKLFAFLSHNAFDATGFFRLPPNRVIELGLQVEL